MSFETFIAFNHQNYYVMDFDEITPPCDPIKVQSNEVFCSPVNPVESMPYTDGSDASSFHIIPSRMHANLDSTDEDHYSSPIECMYTKAFEHVNSGSQGVLLEAPQLPFKKSKLSYDSYILAMYINPSDQQYYKKWITKDSNCLLNRIWLFFAG